MKKTFECEAKLENLEKIMGFVESNLEAINCNMACSMQISLAVEEVFVNIAHYAYGKRDEDGVPIPDTGSGPMSLGLEAEEGSVTLTFTDEGTPYNPLERDWYKAAVEANGDVVIVSPYVDAQTGSVVITFAQCIFMVKKSMDNVIYEYKNGKNVLTLIKQV